MTGRGNATLRAQGSRRRTFRERVKADFGLRQRKAYYVSIPHRSHRRDVSPFPSHFDLFGKPGQFAPNLKILAILFLVLSGSVGGYLWYSSPGNGLFHSDVSVGQGSTIFSTDHRQCVPPCQGAILVGSQQNLFLDSFGSNAQGWQLVNFGGSCNAAWSNSLGVGTIVLTSSASCSAEGLTKNLVDISTVANRELIFRLAWTLLNGGTYPNRWALYFTTNSTLPSVTNYNPFTDKSVALIMAPSNIVDMILYLQQDAFRTITDEGGPTTCPLSTAVQDEFMCQVSGHAWGTTSGPTFNYIDTVLNYSGNSNVGNTGNYMEANVPGGGGCSPCASIRNSADSPSRLNPTEKYYVGIWNGVNNSPIFVQTVFLAQATAWTPPAATPSIDTGGWSGPIIRALIQIGVFVAQNLISFGTYLAGLFWPIFVAALNGLWSLVGSLASAMIGFFIALVNQFESILKALLNTIGQTLGFPTSAACNFVSNPSGCGLGDDLFQEITYLVSTITSTIATFIGGLTNIFTAVLDFFSVITTWFTTWGGYFVNAIVAISNLVVELITVVKQLLLYAPSTFTWGAIILFIVYSSLDGLDGWFAFFETMAWILLFGVSVAEKILNWLISLSVWLVSQIPAFNLQGEAAGTGGGVGGKYMVGFDLPRLPLLEHSFRPSFPHNFTEPEIARFNIFSIMGLVVGTFMLIYAVGANLVPGVNSGNSVNLNLINALLPVGLTLIGALGAVTLPFLLGYLFRNVFRIQIATPSIGVGISTEKIPLRAGKIKGPGFKIGLRPSKHKFQVKTEDGRAKTIRGIRNIIREGKRQSAASQERLRRETEHLRQQQVQQQKQREREAQQRVEQAEKREKNRRELGRTPEGFE